MTVHNRLTCSEPRQSRPGFLFDLGQEGLDVVLDYLIERGSPRGRRRSYGACAPCGAA